MLEDRTGFLIFALIQLLWKRPQRRHKG